MEAVRKETWILLPKYIVKLHNIFKMYKTEECRVIIEQIKESIAQMEQPIIKDTLKIYVAEQRTPFYIQLQGT
jgi:hypothetical protein